MTALQRRSLRSSAPNNTNSEPPTAKGKTEGAKRNTNTLSPPGGDFGKAESQPPVFEDTNFTLLHVNVGNNKGFVKTRAELEAHLQFNSTPDFVALTETLLDKSVGEPTLAGYTLVSR